MANADRPNGAIPVRTMSGSPYSGTLALYEVDSSASNIFPGDFVILEADGKANVAGATSTEILGACVGVLPWMPNKVSGISGHNISTDNINLMLKYHETGAAGYVLVAVGPDVVYEMQEDGVTTDLAVTDIGSNVDIVATAGSTSTGLSLQEINSDSVITATAQLRLLGLVDRPDNELGDWARWEVRINESHFTKLTGV